MRSLRSCPPPSIRGISGALALVTTLALAGCSGDNMEDGPPRLTPNPQHDVAEAMIANGPVPQDRLNACELLDLSTSEIIELTGSDMPVVEPTGSGDLGLICTYGGPGSPERAKAADQSTSEQGSSAATWSDSESDSTSDADSTSATSTSATSTSPTSTSASSTTTGTTTTSTFVAGTVPDTFAAGVTLPISTAEVALAEQSTLLGNRYACSEIRGARAATVEFAPEGAAGAPPPTQPSLDTAYIDCIASPVGGGVEVHTILIEGDYLWHITLLRPEVERSAESEKIAIAGLHRVATQILG